MERPVSPEVTSRISVHQVNVVRKQLADAWEFDPDFYTNLFPITGHTRKTYQAVEKELRYKGRWAGVPAKEPKHASKLYTPLKVFLNNVLLAFDLRGDFRRVLNTSRTRIHPLTTYPTWPPLFLAGTGKHFISSNASRPLPDYAFGISVIEVRLDSEDELPSRDRLATNMQRMFVHQFNRRYAFGVVISQQTFTVYMFDRSGVLYSPPLDYHSNPIQLCAVLFGMASMDEASLGFDTSMSSGTHGQILTGRYLGKNKAKEVVYTAYAILYASPLFLSRGTVCFLVYEASAPKTLYVLKDSWEQVGEFEGRESEGSLLLHAQERGVLKGTVQIRHSEEVHIKNRSGRKMVDSVLGNRRGPPGFHSSLERIHTRIVIFPYGKPLDHFSNRKEFLLAYYDAIRGHRALHDLAGILHRDIKPANVLIYPKGEDGNRGILIDFDHAIRLDNTSPYSKKRKIGTYLFMSRNALEGIHPQTCFDDLESFFYVLVFIVLYFSGPEKTRPGGSILIDRWRRPKSWMAKGGFFTEEFYEKINPYFGKPFETLVKRLHSIFRAHNLRCISAKQVKLPPPVLDTAQLYDDFLTHIRQAIVDLDLDDNSDEEENQEFSSGTTEFSTYARKRKYDAAIQDTYERDSRIHSWMKGSNPQNMKTFNIASTAAASRPRRSCAKYSFRAHGKDV